MKKLILFLFVVFAALTINAQDVIVKKDGSTVLCKIIQVTGNEVIYLKWSDLKGPQYIMDGSLVSNINYQDGRQDKLNEQTSNNYAPGIQQTGDSQYNDNALLALDYSRTNYNPYKGKVRTLTILGWSIGAPLFAAGTVVFLFGVTNPESELYNLGIIGGVVLMGGGIATTTGCLIKAHQLKKKYYSLSCIPFLQRDINTGNGTTLSAGVDIILDNQTHNFIPGLGLQFNF